MEKELLLADGFEAALIGTGERCGQPTIAVYDTKKCIEILQGQGMSYDEAHDYFDFNVVGAWVGDQTPIFVNAR